MRACLKDREIQQSRDPENNVEHKGAEKFRENYLPIVHRCSHERLDGAELKFLGKKPHRNKGKNQNKREPEKNRIKECFLHRIRHRALIHVRNLKIKIDTAYQQEKNENNVGDGRVKITAHFAGEKRVKLSHTIWLMAIDRERAGARVLLGIGRWVLDVERLPAPYLDNVR